MQCNAVHLSDWKGWSQDPPFSRPHLRLGSGGEGISCWRSLPTSGPPEVSSSFLSFLHLWLLHLGSFSFAIAKDFATLLLLPYFPSHCSITAQHHSIRTLERGWGHPSLFFCGCKITFMVLWLLKMMERMVVCGHKKPHR